jgi:fumarate reductase subunit C
MSYSSHLLKIDKAIHHSSLKPGANIVSVTWFYMNSRKRKLKVYLFVTFQQNPLNCDTLFGIAPHVQSYFIRAPKVLRYMEVKV